MSVVSGLYAASWAFGPGHSETNLWSHLKGVKGLRHFEFRHEGHKDGYNRPTLCADYHSFIYYSGSYMFRNLYAIFRERPVSI
jgi:hypothetical protein